MGNLLGVQLIGMRGPLGRFERMADRPVLAAELMLEVRPFQAQITRIFQEAAPYGGDYDLVDRDTHLNRSFKTTLVPTGVGFVLSTSTSQGVVAEVTDKGSRPHMPPVDAITPWAEAHGIDAWALAISIRDKGTQAHPWMGAARLQAAVVAKLIGNRIAARMVMQAQDALS